MKGILKLVIVGIVAAGLAGTAFAMGTDDKKPDDKKDPGRGYTKAEMAVKAKEYKSAIAMLKQVVARNPKHVDALNYLGYSYRQIGQYKRSLVYYKEALSVDPNHRGANEYLGRLYLRLGNKPAARRQLTKLRRLCPRGCEEYDSLRAEIARAS